MTDGWLERAGHPRLRTRLYVPEGTPRGNVLVTTGFSEHIGRYEHVCQRWRDAGWLVATWDLRGQGRSEGVRGFVSRFSQFVDDLFAYADELEKLPAWRAAGNPIFFGHSLGGLITIHAALRASERIRALALTSPFLGRALHTPQWKLWAGRLISGVLPTFSLPTGVAAKDLTHDVERALAIDTDPLAVKRMTARLFTEIEAAQAFALFHAARLSLPISCRAAGADKISDLDATRRFFGALGSNAAQLTVITGAFHELHQERDWETHCDALLADFARWQAP